MKKLIEHSKLIEKHCDEMGGVFRTSDLKTVLNERHTKSLYRSIDQLVEIGALRRFCRGFYVTENPSVEVLSQRLAPKSYVSMTNILSENQMIGISPKNFVEAVKIGKNKFYENEGIQIRHYGIKEELFFGCENIDGLSKATKEKAWLDVMYFHQHGARFLFNPFEDINFSEINTEKIREHLLKYSNPKFIKFIEGLLQ